MLNLEQKESVNNFDLNKIEKKVVKNIDNTIKNQQSLLQLNYKENDPIEFTTKVGENFSDTEKQKIIQKSNEILNNIDQPNFQIIISGLATSQWVGGTENVSSDIDKYKNLYDNVCNILNVSMLDWLGFSKPNDLQNSLQSTTDEDTKKEIGNKNLANWRALSILNVLLEEGVVSINNIDKLTIIIDWESDITGGYVDYDFNRIPKNPPYEEVLIAQKQSYVKSSFETLVKALNSSILNIKVNNAVQEELLGEKDDNGNLISSKINEKNYYSYDQQTLFNYIVNYPIGQIEQSFFNSDDFTNTDEFNKYSKFVESNSKITVLDLLQLSYGKNVSSYGEVKDTETVKKIIYKNSDNDKSEKIYSENDVDYNVFNGKSVNRPYEGETPISLYAIIQRLYYWNSLFLDKELTPKYYKIKNDQGEYKSELDSPVITSIKDGGEIYPFKTTIVTIQKNEYKEISNANGNKTYIKTGNITTYDIILFGSWDEFVSYKKNKLNGTGEEVPYEKYNKNLIN